MGFALASLLGIKTASGAQTSPPHWAHISTHIHDQSDQHPPIVIVNAHSSILPVGPSPGGYILLGKPKPPGSYCWVTDVELKTVARSPVKAVRLEWILYDAACKVMTTTTVDHVRFRSANVTEPQLPISPLGAGEYSATLRDELPVDQNAFALGHYALVLVLSASFTDGAG